MDVSIVVLTWDDFERTAACVRSLPAAAEVIVVDNGSRGEIADALRKLCDTTRAKYVRSDTNLGYAKGMNLGVRFATRGVVVLSNNDLLVGRHAVSGLVAALADEKVGAAFPRVRNADGSDGTDAGRFLSLPVGLAHLTGLGLLVPTLRVRATPARFEWLSGPFVALRRETLDKIGGVDESAFFYSEDMRLCWAVRQLGLEIKLVDDAIVTHENDASAKRRWTREEIALRQTRELIRATRDQGGWSRKAACTAFAYGAVLRAAVLRHPVRRAVAQGALQGLRS
jgi:N-acetylglucosaminyl-diphospho-decaprenol L-rhamnosyltransferase